MKLYTKSGLKQQMEEKREHVLLNHLADETGSALSLLLGGVRLLVHGLHGHQTRPNQTKPDQIIKMVV